MILINFQRRIVINLSFARNLDQLLTSLEHVNIAVVSVSDIEVRVLKDPLLRLFIVANLVGVLTSLLHESVCQVSVQHD